MVDSNVTGDDVVKSSKRGVIVALLLVLIVVGLMAAAYVFLGGAQVVADLLGGGSTNTATAPRPAKSSTATGTASTESSGSASATGTAGAVSDEQAERMYWEQVASQEQIGKLVTGEITAMSFGAVTNSGTTANVRVGVSYKAGGSLSGTMVLRDYSGAWYFSSIARDGNSLAVTTGEAGEPAIISTIVNQQAANQLIVKGIVDGTYKQATVTSISTGAGTATVHLELAGDTSAKSAGSIVCVSKDVNGEKLWFITSFTKD